MAKNKSQLKVFKTVVIVLFILIGLIIFIIARTITADDYCWDNALKVTGSNANTLVDQPNGDKLTMWYLNKTKCEQNTKFFFLF